MRVNQGFLQLLSSDFSLFKSKGLSLLRNLGIKQIMRNYCQNKNALCRSKVYVQLCSVMKEGSQVYVLHLFNKGGGPIMV